MVPSRSAARARIYDVETSGAGATDLSLIASLDAGLARGHIERPGATGDAVVDRVVTRPIATYDWPAVVAAYAVDRAGILQIDAEALDCQLLLAFPFHALRPRVVRFEYSHCDGAFSKRDPSTWVLLNRTRGLLAAYGYEIVGAGADDVTYVDAGDFRRLDAAFLAERPDVYRNGRCKRPFYEWGVEVQSEWLWHYKTA